MDTNNSNGAKEVSASDRYMTPIALVIGAIIIASAFYFGHGTAPVAKQAGNAPAQVAVNIKDVKTAGNPYVGNVNAPVTLAVWFDYQCPYCKMLDDDTLTQVYKNYVQTGKVKIVFKDFAFVGPDSSAAALFARAVWELYPTKFYTWYQAMFAAQDKENTGFGDTASIEKLTKTITGIDVAKVKALLKKKSDTFKAEMTADRKEGAKLGVSGTPSIIIGTKRLDGAVPYSQVSKLIDEQLKAVK